MRILEVAFLNSPLLVFSLLFKSLNNSLFEQYSCERISKQRPPENNMYNFSVQDLKLKGLPVIRNISEKVLSCHRILCPFLCYETGKIFSNA